MLLSMRAILTIGCISFCLGLAYYFGTPVRHANHPSPENVPVYLAIGSDPPNLGLLQCELGDYDQTIRNGRGDALIYRTRAYLREELGDHRGAIEDYSEAILLDPKDAGSYLCRGR